LLKRDDETKQSLLRDLSSAGIQMKPLT